MSRRIYVGVLIVGSIGVLINIVDVIVSERVEPHHAFPALIALAAGAELLKKKRPREARTLYAAASVLLVIAGSVAGWRAWAQLFRGADHDWLDLTLGALVVLYLAVGAGQLLTRKSRKTST